MARANRHHIPGQIWHITHRCHKQEFLLKFGRDGKAWLHWLFEAKKRYGLQILNYAVTSNHIHLLVRDVEKDVIPKSIQLVAGRIAQEYNQRKKRKGAYWEDRYHATAVETGEHFFRCLAYIDLNMVRNGVVSHPSEWAYGGYNEIQHPPRRYTLINRKHLIACCGMTNDEQLRREHRQLVEDALNHNRMHAREPEWTEAVAVGSEAFIEKVRQKLATLGRQMTKTRDQYILRENEAAYNTNFAPENAHLNTKNTYFWRLNEG